MTLQFVSTSLLRFLFDQRRKSSEIFGHENNFKNRQNEHYAWSFTICKFG